MHNIISLKNLLALLKCVPLHPNQIWDIYAYQTVRFRSNNQFPSKEVFRTPCGQVRRAAKDITLLYKYRWQVEVFFKWIKQHLWVKSLWGESDNAVRIRFMLSSSHTVSSESLSTISSMDVQSCKSCESWAGPCLPKTTLWTSSPRLRMIRKQMMVSSNLNLYTINIY